MSLSYPQSDSHLSIPSSSGRKASPVRLHCRTPTEAEKDEKSHHRKWMWCKYCTYSAQSTTAMQSHLRKEHTISLELSTSSIRTIASTTIEGLYEQLLIKVGEESEVDSEIFRRTVNQEVVTQALRTITSSTRA